MKVCQAPPLVSVNILTYNAQDLIEQCLKSVLEQSYTNLEILVIDNASTDKTLESIWRIRMNSDIRIAVNKKNLGFATGHNIGIRESKGKYILCLNQDVVLDKDFVKSAVEVMEKDEKIGSIQGKLLRITAPAMRAARRGGRANINELRINTIDVTGLVMFKNRRVVARGQGEEDKNQYEAGEIFGVDGAAPFYRRKALEDIKINNEYFDEDFFCYKEDVDLAWRMRLYGWKAIYEPMAIGYHLRGAGERAVKNYISVVLARRKLSKFAKFYSFKNDRLMRIKNELPSLFFRDIFSILIKETGAWLYVLLFEHYTWKASKELFRQIPNALRKRKIIMANKKVGSSEMKKWFV